MSVMPFQALAELDSSQQEVTIIVNDGSYKVNVGGKGHTIQVVGTSDDNTVVLNVDSKETMSAVKGKSTTIAGLRIAVEEVFHYSNNQDQSGATIMLGAPSTIAPEKAPEKNQVTTTATKMESVQSKAGEVNKETRGKAFTHGTLKVTLLGEDGEKLPHGIVVLIDGGIASITKTAPASEPVSEPAVAVVDSDKTTAGGTAAQAPLGVSNAFQVMKTTGRASDVNAVDVDETAEEHPVVILPAPIAEEEFEIQDYYTSTVKAILGSGNPVKIEPGVYSLQAFAEGYAPYFGTVTVVAGDTTDLDITLTKGGIQQIYVPVIDEVEGRKVITEESVTVGRAGISAGDVVATAQRSDVSVEKNEIFITAKDGVVKKQVKIMPNRAAAIAKENQGIDDISDVEIGMEGNVAQYRIKAKEKRNFLGFIPVEVDVVVTVDAETGEQTTESTPWDALYTKG